MDSMQSSRGSATANWYRETEFMAEGTVVNGVLHMSGPLTFNTVGDRFRESGVLLAAAEPVTAVDLEQVENVDSAGLALLLEWQSMARRQGNELAFRNAPRDLLRLAALAEASDLLGLLPVPELAHDQLD